MPSEGFRTEVGLTLLRACPIFLMNSFCTFPDSVVRNRVQRYKTSVQLLWTDFEKKLKICIFHRNRAFSGRKLPNSGVIDTRNDLLRELFAPNVQGIKGIRAVGTVFEEVFLGLGKLLAGLVFVEAVAPVQYSGRLNGEDKIIVILTVEKRYQTSICPPLDCPKLLDNAAAVIN